MKRTLLTCLTAAHLLLSAASATLAGPGEGHRGGGEEARTYLKTNVLPVIRQQRQKLETQLAPVDRDQLATYRTQLKELRTQEQALHQQLRAASPGPQGRPTLTDAQHQQLHSLREQNRAIREGVLRLAQKYASNMEQLDKEIAPQQAKWATDLQALHQKYRPTDAPARPADAPGARPETPGHHGPGGPGFDPGFGPEFFGHHGAHTFYFRPSAFLLMPADAEAAPATFGGTSLYPNPATAATQLQYDVKKAGPVTVDLLDASGTRLRTLVQQPQQTTGTHTEALDFGDLPHGTYYYKITTASGTETKRFVKE